MSHRSSPVGFGRGALRDKDVIETFILMCSNVEGLGGNGIYIPIA